VQSWLFCEGRARHLKSELLRYSNDGCLFMGLLLLEALFALCILIFIVWWIMFAGRSAGELPKDASSEKQTSERE
jgi:hypothetical protein